MSRMAVWAVWEVDAGGCDGVCRREVWAVWEVDAVDSDRYSKKAVRPAWMKADLDTISS